MSYLSIVNNNILGNTYHGIYLGTHENDIGQLVLLNNIIGLNGQYAVYNHNCGYVADPSGVLVYEITHNDFTGNSLGNCYNYYTGKRTISCSDSSNISENPQFVDRFAGNYCLEPSSPCINAGRPGIAYNDPDNSINDIGAYGGPRAIGCFFGGPVVTELSVSPGTVEEGTPVTIRAKGVAR